jgi:NADPH-dependent curcumin reductase CurA
MLKDGQLKFKAYITKGFENIPKTQVEMMQGKNIGKACVKLEEY